MTSKRDELKMRELYKGGRKAADETGRHPEEEGNALNIMDAWKIRAKTEEAIQQAKEFAKLTADLDPCADWQCVAACGECPAAWGFPELCTHLLDLARIGELGECDTCVEKDTGLCRTIRQSLTPSEEDTDQVAAPLSQRPNLSYVLITLEFPP